MSERFPSILRGLENLENRKKVLEFDLEGVKLSIQREEQVKFEAKIVLDNLREFSRLIDEVEPSEKPHLFQYLIKSISYGRDEVGIDLFYFPQGHLSTWGTHRACPETRAAEDGEIAEGRRSSLEQGRRTLTRRPSGGQMGEAGEHLVGSKNRSEWLPIPSSCENYSYTFRLGLSKRKVKRRKRKSQSKEVNTNAKKKRTGKKAES